MHAVRDYQEQHCVTCVNLSIVRLATRASPIETQKSRLCSHSSLWPTDDYWRGPQSELGIGNVEISLLEVEF